MGLLLEAYKTRLGVSEFNGISYNISELIVPQNLDTLDDDFTEKEITQVIKALPNSHALRLDGFNGLFNRKAWSIIK